MSIFSSFRSWLAARGITRRFSYPALAEANKALLVVEEQVVNFQSVAPQMEEFKKAQNIKENERDQALIPIYLSIENFVVSHEPPLVKQVLTTEQVRDKVRRATNLDQMSVGFRLIFLPDNQQADYLLKIGILEMLRFLLTSLGRVQLGSLVKQAGADTALAAIEVSDDGISFEPVHKTMATLAKPVVMKAYQQFYTNIFQEVVNLFGQKQALELVAGERQKIETTYNQDLVAIYLAALPAATIVNII